MADPAPPPADEPNVSVSVLRNLAGAVGLVVVVAAVFGVIGMIGRADDTPTPVAADGPDAGDEPTTEPEDATEPATGAPTVEADAPDADEVDDPPAPDAEPDGDDGGTTGDAGTAGDGATTDGRDDDAAEGAADEPDTHDEGRAGTGDRSEDSEDSEDADTGSSPPALARSDISIQVLDGYKSDGGVAAREVAVDLRDRGYRVVAENQAISYERTAVLWTDGNEAAARQVAADIGAAEVREQPGNLSSAVDVHVVVGADRA